MVYIEHGGTLEVLEVVVLIGLHKVAALLHAIPVHDAVVGDARNPELELPGVGI